MTFTSAWVTFENTLALRMFDWYKWYLEPVDPETGEPKPEPELDNWTKNAIRKMVDISYAFQAYKKATIQEREWRMLALWDVTLQQLNSGYAVHGDAETGGDYGVIGYWTWETRDDQSSIWQAEYNWRPSSVIKYMPDECVEFGPDTGECVDYGPATRVWDVNLLAGQPPRVLPPQVIIIQDVAQGIKDYLESEGWDVDLFEADDGSKQIKVIYNGDEYIWPLTYLFQCDFEDLPSPLTDDLTEAMQLQGFCL